MQCPLSVQTPLWHSPRLLLHIPLLQQQDGNLQYKSLLLITMLTNHLVFLICSMTFLEDLMQPDFASHHYNKEPDHSIDQTLHKFQVRPLQLALLLQGIVQKEKVQKVR